VRSLTQIGTRLLRLLPPEDAHRATIRVLQAGLGPRCTDGEDAGLETTLAGLKLPNPIGLAAGFDKNAEAPDAMLRAGFGFVECGTVTPLPQQGNPKPRLFRLVEDRGVINRLGFNNGGLDAYAGRLAARRKRPGIVGANIGANKDTTDRIADYVVGYKRVHGLASYVTINVSSPNTPGLRGLQDRGPLEELLGRLSEAKAELGARNGHTPLFLKVAPDLDESAITTIADVVRANAIDVLIVSNTTIDRPGSLKSAHRGEAGGLSGAPLMSLSTQVLALFAEAFGGGLPLIGVGGIASGADAWAKIRAGASAVQLYSALIFEGPSLVQAIKRELRGRMKAEGFATIAEAVGTR